MNNRIKVRQARIEDIPDILIVEEEAWPDGLQASEAMFVSRIETFPKGVLVAENTDRIVGVVVTQRVKYDLSGDYFPSWREITDDGYICKTHDPEGDTIYGVDLSVSPLSGGGASKALMLAIGKLVIRLNLKQIVLGGRMPRYHKYVGKMTPQEYIAAKTSSGKCLDPEIWFYLKAGLQIVKVIPDYFEDPESCNNGVLLAWKNPFHNKPLRWLMSLIFRV